MAAITLSRKKPEGLQMKIPRSVLTVTESLNKSDIRKWLVLLLAISEGGLYKASQTFDKKELKKITKINKDLKKIQDEY